MAPLNDEQLHQIRDERRDQIMQAALKVFARRGCLGTKMSMIAAEAGISHGLLYHYFKSKDELFITLVRDAMTEAASEMNHIYELPGSPIEKIKALTENILDEKGAPYFLLIHQTRTAEGVPEEARQLVEHYSMERFVEQLLPLFTEGQQLGEIAEGDASRLIASYLSILSGLMVLHAQEGGGYRMPETGLLLRFVQGR
ncbi:TetR/AcrR family transcriptional regulator [Paenibacillus sp. TAB 01]|uniref:TetR/AcrR family transcriptional regulator n=1 Tax=Paenibacillus sp. TAB 01 TaxID=3368988 RepID=UPI003750879A